MTIPEAHAGLFSNDPIPIDPSLPRRTLLELLSQRALQELDGKQEEARLAPVSQCVGLHFPSLGWKWMAWSLARPISSTNSGVPLPCWFQGVYFWIDARKR